MRRILLSILVPLAVLASAAPSYAATRCVAQGRAVTLSDARWSPDWSVKVRTGHHVRLPDHLDGASDLHAYPLNGAASRSFQCTARDGVDEWTEYRSRGRVIAVFDGAVFTAKRAVVVAAWMG
jgi:hypothetical protein